MSNVRLYRGYAGSKLHVSSACAGPNSALETTMTEEELRVALDDKDRFPRICRRCANYRTYGGHRP